MIVGLIANNEAQRSRTAARIAKNILGNAADPELAELAVLLQIT
jgi:hypothetical protein